MKSRLTLTLLFVQTALTMLASAAPAATETLWLSGRDRASAVPWDFFCTAGRNSGRWVKLPVPSQWDVLGHGTLHYDRDDTGAPIEQGLYRHRFAVPAQWTGRRVFLVFDGAMTDTTAMLNGRSVGPTHQGGFYQFRYEVTPFVRFGADNLLEVAVDKHSANESVNHAERNADFWVFGGIYRPVRLEAVPTQFIARVAIDARADGRFTADLTLDGLTDAATATVELLDADGHTTGVRAEASVNAGTASVRLAASLPNLRTWTAETPRLYTARFSLRREGMEMHQREQRFGFRTIEVRPTEGIFVNGRRVILKGVNRHSFRPESGRTLSEEDQREDIALIHSLNMNAVRMSHYPPDERFLELCDELGLYVLDELGGWQKSYDTPTGRRLVEAMVTRDVNHPSILFWDNGNENGWNTELDGEFARWDPQSRTVLHPWDTFSGINTIHYPTYEETAAAAEGLSFHRVLKVAGKGRYRHVQEPSVFMPTEFMHGLYDGGMGAGFEDYWAVMSGMRALGGAFFWVFADEGLKRPDTGEIDVVGNRAPDGLVGPYLQREASAATIQEIWSPIVIRERELPEDFAGTVTVENHYDFINANTCRFHWELRDYPAPGRLGGTSVIASGEVPAPDLAPGAVGKCTLPLPAGWRRAGALALRVDNAAGRALWTWVWPLARVGGSAPRAASAATFDETAEAVTLRAGGFHARFARHTGYLAGAGWGEHEWSLANGPRPAQGEARLVRLTTGRDGDAVTLTAGYEGALSEVHWRLEADGTLACDYRYRAEGEQPFIGVVFDLPAGDVRSKRWLGDGPYRVWQNRRRGVTYGLWESAFNDTITGYRGWVYPEFQGCFANVRWMEFQTTAGPLVMEPLTPDLFVQVLNPEFPEEKLARFARVDLPGAGLGLLHAIPAIGNKFFPAAQTGPQSQPSRALGEYRGSFRLRFGRSH